MGFELKTAFRVFGRRVSAFGRVMKLRVLKQGREMLKKRVIPIGADLTLIV